MQDKNVESLDVRPASVSHGDAWDRLHIHLNIILISALFDLLSEIRVFILTALGPNLQNFVK